MDQLLKHLSVHIIQFLLYTGQNGYTIQMHTLYLYFISYGQKYMVLYTLQFLLFKCGDNPPFQKGP